MLPTKKNCIKVVMLSTGFETTILRNETSTIALLYLHKNKTTRNKLPYLWGLSQYRCFQFTALFMSSILNSLQSW
jgi:hypothetical protein